MDQQLPQPPQMPQSPDIPQFAPCPKCGNTRAKKVRYTWWGGFLGPAIMSQVDCLNCGTSYNGKSGAPASKGIIIYIVVSLVVACLIFGGCALLASLSSSGSYSGLTFLL